MVAPVPAPGESTGPPERPTPCNGSTPSDTDHVVASPISVRRRPWPPVRRASRRRRGCSQAPFAVVRRSPSGPAPPPSTAPISRPIRALHAARRTARCALSPGVGEDDEADNAEHENGAAESEEHAAAASRRRGDQRRSTRRVRRGSAQNVETTGDAEQCQCRQEAADRSTTDSPAHVQH